MENHLKVSLSITKDYCHKEVIELFREFSNGDLQLFAITSDIDNLGEFIAYNGRARGQNLVDYYTNLIAEFIINKSCTEDIPIVFIPAGEEVSIFGLCRHTDEFSRFSNGLRAFVNDKIINSSMPVGKTGIKFGGKIIDEALVIKEIKEFVYNIEHQEDFNLFEDYYEILFKIRTAVSPHVDFEKFRTLGVKEDNELVLLRNVIYYELLEYKKNTQELLRELVLNEKLSELPVNLMENYGLDEEKIDKILEMKGRLFVNEIKH